MSSPTMTKKVSLTKRSTTATAELRTLVGRDDLKLLSVALAEATISFAKTNPTLLAKVREVYDDLATNAITSKQKSTKVIPAKLVPIIEPGRIGFGPNDAIDPYKLIRLYGKDQLAQALGNYLMSDLKEATEMVMQRNPGTKPKSKTRRDDLINYIVEYVIKGQ